MPLSSDDVRWLAVGLCRSARFLATASTKLTLEDIPPQHKELKALLTLSMNWYSLYKTPPAISYLVSELDTNESLKRALTPSELEALVSLLEFSHSAEKTDEEIEKLGPFLLDKLRRLLELQVQQTAKNLALPGADVSKGFEAVRKAISRANIADVDFVQLFEGDEPMLGGHNPQPWGVEFMDRIAGGTTPGETILVLAPSGGGKTLTNIQMATQLALNGHKSLVFSYEQGVWPKISDRIYAYALGLPLPTITGQAGLERFRQMPEAKARWNEVREILRENMHVVDMVSTGARGGAAGGAEDVAGTIMRLQDSGVVLRYVGVDWLRPMVDNYMAAKGMRPSDLTTVMGSMANSLRKVSQTLMVNVCIFHQLGTDAANRKGFRVPLMTEAQDCRTLSNWVDTVICIGPRDTESNIAVVGVPKLRNGEVNKNALIKMEGAKSRFIIADGAHISRCRTRVIIDSVEHALEHAPPEVAEPERKVKSIACTTNLL